MIQKLDINRKVTTQDFNMLIDAINSMEITGAKGVQIRKTAGGTVLMSSASGTGLECVVRITGSDYISPNKWSYAGLVQSFDGTSWNDTAMNVSLFNLCEVNNSYETREDKSSVGTGLVGNGVSTNNIQEGYAVMPAPEGVLVPVYKINGVLFFNHENAIDGSCA